jgi:hypothetical protein
MLLSKVVVVQLKMKVRLTKKLNASSCVTTTSVFRASIKAKVKRLAPRPGRFTPGKGTRCPLYGWLWAPGPVWTGGENLASTAIRSPDCPARIDSLYRLSYSGTQYAAISYLFLNMYHLQLYVASKKWSQHQLLDTFLVSAVGTVPRIYCW